MNVYLTRTYKNQNHAGSKAPEDINRICEKLGWNRIEVFFSPVQGQTRIVRFLKNIPNYCRYIKRWNVAKKLKPENIFYQHPLYRTGDGILADLERKITASMFSMNKKENNSKIIILVHDLNALRFGESNKEIKFLDTGDYIICHNERMKRYLIEQGIKREKLITLEIFDYLCEQEDSSEKEIPQRKSVAIAGNLAETKSGYIYKFLENKPNLQVNLYGVNYQKKVDYPNVLYHGSFTPEELPKKLNAAFGIVWDGPEVTTCGGNFGRYLKYNNPHKLSLYMTAGMPVITWKQAAIADFVEKHCVGVTVDSLENLSQAIEMISDEDYEKMRNNARKIGARLKEGFYFKRAWEEVLMREKAKTKEQR